MSCLPTRPRKDSSSRTRTRSATFASTPIASRARGTFHRLVPFCLPHALTRGTAFRAATGAPVLPPRAQLPTRVHGTCPLDTKSVPAIRRSLGATCRLSTSAIEQSVNTPPNASDSARVDSKPSTAPTAPLREWRQPSFRRSGAPCFRLSPHPIPVRSEVDLPQPA